jgi:RNA polymerase sigma-70 factor, ECF subfamily
VDDESAVFAYVKTRDPALFRLIVERYQTRVLRLVSAMLGTHADREAQEVTQEVFLRANEKIGSFRCEARFATWLYRLTYNRAAEHRRTARIRLPHVSAEAVLKLAADPLRSEAQIERQQLVAHLMEDLPDVYRTVLHLHYWLDASVEEIAETLCVPAGTVKSYLSRARQRLREQAQLQGIDLSE